MRAKALLPITADGNWELNPDEPSASPAQSSLTKTSSTMATSVRRTPLKPGLYWME
ncbi:MAG: hypothetical protein U0797_18520 [Gemmataceae bacterium]